MLKLRGSGGARALVPHIASDASVLYKLCLQIFACNSLEKPYMCSELSISIGRTLSDGKLLPSCSLCAFSCLLTNDYISKICVRQLRSADTRTLVVSRTRSSFGERTFVAAGPQVWNSRPISDYVGCHTASSGGY